AECGNQRLYGFFPYFPLFPDAPAERVQLDRALALAEPQLHASAREQVEGGHALGDADRVIGRQLDDAVAEPDTTRALGRGAEEDLGGRAVRVLLEEVVLDQPGVVVAQPVRQLDLLQRVLEELILAPLVPRTRKLVLIKDTEFHAHSWP